MKITALYEDKNNVLATAQVSGAPDEDEGRGFELEASIQFINGPHAVEFDFSAFTWVHEDGGNLKEEKERILTEIDAVHRLVDQVTSFQTAFLQAANAGLAHLDALA